MRDSLEDIRKKFRGTYCFLELNGKQHLTEFTGDNEEDQFFFRSPVFGDVIVDRETIDNCMTYRFPKSGLYNLQGQAVEFVRLPERQWKRAPFRENCIILQLLPAIQVTFSRAYYDVNLLNLEEIYKEVYPESLDTAIVSLKYSMALDKNFAISQSPTENYENELLFWFRKQPIGIINPAKRTIEVRFLPLLQEVQDFIRTKEPTWQLMKKPQ